MANVGSRGVVRYEETFATDTIGTAGDGIAWIITNDTSDTPWARAVAAGKGLHAVGTLHATDNNRLEFLSDKFIFSGQEGHCSVECLLQLSVVTDIAINFGFFDAVTGPSNVIPAQISGTTLAGSAADGFLGLVLDTDADNDEFHCTWENGAVVTTTPIADLRMNGMGLTADQWFYMKVEMQDAGSGNPVIGTFLVADHTGKSAEKRFTTTVDRDLPLCWYLGLENRAATTHIAYLKLPSWEQTISDM